MVNGCSLERDWLQCTRTTSLVGTTTSLRRTTYTVVWLALTQILLSTLRANQTSTLRGVVQPDYLSICAQQVRNSARVILAPEPRVPESLTLLLHPICRSGASHASVLRVPQASWEPCVWRYIHRVPTRN